MASRSLIRFGALRGGLLGNPLYTNARRGSPGSDEPTARAASLMMLGHPYLPTLMPHADTTFSEADKRMFVGLYADIIP